VGELPSANGDGGEFDARQTGCERFDDKNEVTKMDVISTNNAQMKRRKEEGWIE